MSVGGNGSGPSPYEYLLAGLGACTSMTIRLYADLKKIPLERVSVLLKHDKIHAVDCEECETKEGKIDRIDREITLEGDLSAEQRAKLMEIADKCPVHRTLARRDQHQDHRRPHERRDRRGGAGGRATRAEPAPGRLQGRRSA